MKKRLHILGLLALVLVVPFAALTSAQQGDESSPSDIFLEITGVDSTAFPTTVLNVNVYDGFGQSVTGLNESDFLLGGDGVDASRIVRVENVLDDNLPVSVVLVIDTSSSMDGSPINAAKEAAALFVQSLNEQDNVALLTFNSRVTLAQDFTTDKQALLSAIDSIRAEGQTALYDASVQGVLTALNAPTERRTVILLSDGAEYGTNAAGEYISPSRNRRGDAIQLAQEQGVSLFTIGLGYGVDRSYLQELTAGTSARAYESPSPDQLPGIYAEIAALLRSQYIVTLETDVPLDGTEYAVTLQADTPRGLSTEDGFTVRAPIPVPLIRAPDEPAEPLTEMTTFVFDILTDDPPLDIVLGIPENVTDAITGVLDTPTTITVDPRLAPPGDVALSLAVTDADGDNTTLPFNFSIASLPSEWTLNGIEAGQVFEDRFTPADTLDIRADVDYSQTPVQSVEFTLDNLPYATVTEAPYSVSIPVLTTLQDGEHTLTVTVITESGEQTSESVSFFVGIIATETPTLTATSTPTATPTADFAATDAANQASTATVDAFMTATSEAESTLQAGAITATAEYEANVQATQSALDAQATESAATQAALDAQATQNANRSDNATAVSSALDSLNNLGGTQAAEQQATFDAAQQLNADATGTADAFAQMQAANASETAIASTQAAEDAAELVRMTEDAQSTLEAENARATESAALTLEAENARATESAALTLEAENAEATESAALTLEAQSTLEAEATAEALETANAALTETAAAQVTETPTLTVQPSATSIEELIEVETGADSEGGDNFAQLLPFAIGGAVLVLILLLLLFGRGKKETPPQA